MTAVLVCLIHDTAKLHVILISIKLIHMFTVGGLTGAAGVQ